MIIYTCPDDYVYMCNVIYRHDFMEFVLAHTNLFFPAIANRYVVMQKLTTTIINIYMIVC